MGIKIINGNIFTSKCQTIVNTVNCVGVMGAGMALECRLRYPEMHEKYILLCKDKLIDIGLLWIYKSPEKWILNFPTKMNWKYPSKKEYLHKGLKKFVDTFKQKDIQSIAFPLLGTDKGGIPQDESLLIMTSYLKEIDLDVEIYKYDTNSKDDLYDKTKEWLLNHEVEYITKSTGLRKDIVVKVIDVIKSSKIVQINQLAREKGIGIKTLEKIFAVSGKAIPTNSSKKFVQQSLF